MVFGSLDQSLSAARSLHRRHAEIKGRLSSAAGPFPAGSRYYANEVPALCWVHATLIETALLAYELVLPPLTPEQRERYYSESRLFAALFGIPDESLPHDWTAFSTYIAGMVQSDTLTVTDQARIMARRLITGAGHLASGARLISGAYRRAASAADARGVRISLRRCRAASRPATHHS